MRKPWPRCVQRSNVSSAYEARELDAAVDKVRELCNGTATRPVPADVERTLRELTETSIDADDVTDLYAAAEMSQPDLSQLDEAFIARVPTYRCPRTNSPSTTLSPRTGHRVGSGQIGAHADGNLRPGVVLGSPVTRRAEIAAWPTIARSRQLTVATM